MNKKGFTLIEIIICIVIIAVIGTVSIIGFNIALKNIRINKLKDIEDEIMTAAKIYLETNDTAQTQLYNNKNAVVVPLNVLVNEGLLDISTTELKKSDIENEYVITALSGGSRDDNCVDITTNGSWNLSKEAALYICTNTTTGSSNLAIINPTSMSNANKAMLEPYVFRGADPNNYIKYTKDGTDYLYRIYYIDTDDSMVLVSDDSFGNVFKDNELLPICGNYYPEITNYCRYTSNNSTSMSCRYDVYKLADTYYYDCDFSKNVSSNTINYYNISLSSSDNYFSLNNNCVKDDKKEKEIEFNDLRNTVMVLNTGFESYLQTYFSCTSSVNHETSSTLGVSIGSVHTGGTSTAYIDSFLLSCRRTYFKGTNQSDRYYSSRKCSSSSDGKNYDGTMNGVKIHLNSCMKIESGTGNKATPYILKNKC